MFKFYGLNRWPYKQVDCSINNTDGQTELLNIYNLIYLLKYKKKYIYILGQINVSFGLKYPTFICTWTSLMKIISGCFCCNRLLFIRKNNLSAFLRWNKKNILIKNNVRYTYDIVWCSLYALANIFLYSNTELISLKQLMRTKGF